MLRLARRLQQNDALEPGVGDGQAADIQRQQFAELGEFGEARVRDFQSRIFT